ncbi:hypothetical protein MZM54_01370 [[Brevibacterium] frigoritolerans]|nr:hypothetical protein [Peribacillus frigoritolerans]
MMKKITKLFVTFAFAFIAVLGISAITDIGFGLDTVAASVFDGKSVSGNATGTEANAIIAAIFKAANVFAAFVLGISIIMIIVGGLKYILANGDQRAAESGKMILIYSGIGIVIALSAFVIAKLFASFKF